MKRARRDPPDARPATEKCEKMQEMPRLRVASALLAVLALALASRRTPSRGAPGRRPRGCARAQRAAMYEFLLARRAEARTTPPPPKLRSSRAVALDPPSAELQAELAGFLARQNRAADAVAAAERAVSLDAESEEGHRILGLVHAAWADGAVEGPSGGTTEAWRTDGHRPPDAHSKRRRRWPPISACR